MNKELVESLRCPRCTQMILLSKSDSCLVCVGCRQKYDIKKNIPIFVNNPIPETDSQRFYEEFSKKLNKKNYEIYFNRRWKYIHRTLKFTKQKHSRILELGCGEGNMIASIKEKLLGNADCVEMTGIDYSFNACNFSRNRFGETVNVVQADAERLPFRNEYFDIILSNALLHHISNQASALDEAVRVTKPESHLIFIEPNRYHPLQITYGLLQKSERGTLSFSINQTKKILMKSGKIEKIDIFPLNTFLFSYRKFPRGILFKIMKKLEPLFDVKYLSTHYLIIAKRSRSR